ncbi:rod shape-determining protein MreD [Paenibacillus sp. MBLB4367]|uniref:rod shape-determining protein MreD n=1 Tax=Paenibacillus sp. MBLB4367 TaxID=3384767 RepID=UPI003907FC83
MMRQHWLIALLFLVFLLEGTVLQLLVPVVWQTKVTVSPQLILLAVLYISVFLGRHRGVVYGLGFGLLHDIVYYGPMIGTYSFGLGFCAYLVGWLAQRTRGGIFSSLLLIAIGNLVFLWIHYGIYRIFQITHNDVEQTFLYQMVPSLLVDLLIALAIYVPMRKLLEPLAFPQAAEDE